MIKGVEFAELAAAQIYAQGWDPPDSLEWGRDYFERLVLFLQAAAVAGDAVIDLDRLGGAGAELSRADREERFLFPASEVFLSTTADLTQAGRPRPDRPRTES